jgi:hypothetical protein
MTQPMPSRLRGDSRPRDNHATGEAGNPSVEILRWAGDIIPLASHIRTTLGPVLQPLRRIRAKRSLHRGCDESIVTTASRVPADVRAGRGLWQETGLPWPKGPAR